MGPRRGTRTSRGRGCARRRVRHLGVTLLAAGLATPAGATDFRIGELFGLLDLRASYGLLFRLEDRDSSLVASSAGGNGSSADIDDGNLNYDRGVAAHVIRGSGDLTLSWRWFGAFVRGYAFYDFENGLEDRERTALSNGADDDVTAGGGLLDHYVSARFELLGMPVQLRAGDQVLNWGESTFLRDSIDIINPADFTQIFQPGSEARDAFRPLGMVWGVATLTERLSLEAFYQYEWKDVKAPPVGNLYSAFDAFGADGVNYFQLGAGTFSDLGTDLDDFYDQTPGTLGFDPDYMQLPGLGRDPAKNGEQFGVTVSVIVPEWNATKLAWHYIRFHSRLPIVSGRTADQDAIDATTQAAVDALAADLEARGVPAADAPSIAEDITMSGYANEAGFELVYPEDVHMLGTSFNAAVSRTGTLLSGETSHRFNAPVQRSLSAVIGETLSPIEFDGNDGNVGADEAVKGYDRRHKTQTSLNLTQLFGPQLGASSTALGADIAWAWVHDEDVPERDDHSFGYRILGSMTYDNVFGAVAVSPFVLFTHDFQGTTPGPGGAFIEDRKSVAFGLDFVYLNALTANVTYTGFFDAGTRNRLRDRDALRFSIAYSF